MLAALFASLGLALATVNGPQADEDVQKALDQVAADWRAAYQAGDFDAMSDLYEPDTWLMTRDRPARKTRDAVLGYFEASRAAGAKARIVFEQESLVVDHPYAFKTAHWWLEVPGANGDMIKDRGRSFVIFKQGDDGQWRIWRDMDNHSPDVPPRDLSATDTP
ncbi:MAG: DUF4440 domain-containing protein [Pseudomonadota bacterium]